MLLILNVFYLGLDFLVFFKFFFWENSCGIKRLCIMRDSFINYFCWYLGFKYEVA